MPITQLHPERRPSGPSISTRELSLLALGTGTGLLMGLALGLLANIDRWAMAWGLFR